MRTSRVVNLPTIIVVGRHARRRRETTTVRMTTVVRAKRVGDDDGAMTTPMTGEKMSKEEEKGCRRRARVCVVGAGAAGLAAIRALRLESHDVVAYELASEEGGTWRYSESVELDDVAGEREDRARVHGSMYASLRTNLPREVMGFEEFPFSMRAHAGDARRFCGHREVQSYLKRYAQTFGLTRDVEYDRRVVRVERVVRENALEEERWSSQWSVTTASSRCRDVVDTKTEMFDAVVVANGHYSEPRVPEFKGALEWPGKRVHSHNYRVPDEFAGKKVLLIGAMASGEDLSREIGLVADKVYLSARTWQNPAWAHATEGIGARGNIFRKPNVAQFNRDGSIEFEDGSIAPECDVCMYCTGYKYAFPFLPDGVVRVEDNCVSPLYEHCIAANALSMSFIGLPWKVVPFPMFELQARWIARMLSGAVPMPSADEALRGAAALESQLEPNGPLPRRHAHCFGDAQFEYNDRMAKLAGVAPHAGWRARMYKATGLNKRANPETYRDAEMPDAEELEAAEKEFKSIDIIYVEAN